ncbi:hypothetical protein HY632_01045 [Candidatus Uhrbacteria bacterium]|nr:hypothetical protein [Candidatus Uhrbacteria bacterium]
MSHRYESTLLLCTVIASTTGCVTTFSWSHEPIAVLHERPSGCHPRQWGAQCLEVVNTLPAPILVCVDGTCLRMEGDPRGFIPDGARAYIRVEHRAASHTLTYTAFDEVRTQEIALATPSMLWHCAIAFTMRPNPYTFWGGTSIRIGQRLADCRR